MNRPPRPQERYPSPPFPRLALGTCLVAPALALGIGLETSMFDVFRIPLGMGASVPVGYLAVAIAAFPLMMPKDVRHLAAVVSVVLMGALALPWLPRVGVFFLPTAIVLFFVWATNHPRLLADLVNTGEPE